MILEFQQCKTDFFRSEMICEPYPVPKPTHRCTKPVASAALRSRRLYGGASEGASDGQGPADRLQRQASPSSAQSGDPTDLMIGRERCSEVSGFILHVDPTRGSSVPTKSAVKRVADFLVATPASSLDRAPPRRFGPSAPPPLLSTGFVHDIPIVIQYRLAYAMRDGCGSH
jgi:hypothetical protein